MQLTQDGCAGKAAETAYLQAKTMIPGIAGQMELTQLGFAHLSKSDKESIFLKQVVNIGACLDIPVSEIDLPSLEGKHYCLDIRAVAEYTLHHYPLKLLAGLDVEEFKNELLMFWGAFKHIYPSHPVFRSHSGRLDACIPVKVHIDEGTGLRKRPVYQFSWGPIMSCSRASWNRYFFWSCITNESYKQWHCGYEKGNKILDELAAHFADQARSVFERPITSKSGLDVYLVFVGHEGDLPAQARSHHLVRNLNCLPNPLCPWCNADDRNLPFSDFKPTAKWRHTIGNERPWNSESPLHSIPGAHSEEFLCKDLFHLCHLGAVRGFGINLLCYLCFNGRFAALLNLNGF